LVDLLGAEPVLLLRLLGGLQVESPGRELPTTTMTNHLSVFTYGRFWLDCLPTRNFWMCLGGGQVAVLRLHAAVSLPRNDCTILAELGERITQLQYFLRVRSYQALRSLDKATFLEAQSPRTSDVRSLRSSVNSGKVTDRSLALGPGCLSVRSEQSDAQHEHPGEKHCREERDAFLIWSGNFPRDIFPSFSNRARRSRLPLRLTSAR
jgi:hypothetical protein